MSNSFFFFLCFFYNCFFFLLFCDFLLFLRRKGILIGLLKETMSDECVYKELEEVPVSVLERAWDSKEWLERYKRHEENARANDVPLWRDDHMSTDRLCAAATTVYLTSGHSICSVEDGTVMTIEPPNMKKCKSQWHKKAYAPVDPEQRRYPRTLVRVVNSDTIDFASSLLKRAEATGEKRKVFVLNMANQFTPGGGFSHGRLAQEEVLCFCTGLFHCLDKKEYEGPNGFGDFSASTHENVPVLRKGLNDGFAFLKPEERWELNVVSMASYDRHKLPKEERSGPFSPEQYAGMHAKIAAILSACVHAGADTLVLGALGCGAFANPPNQVAEIFARVLHRFAGYFDAVYFSILAAPTDPKLAIFQKELVGKEIVGDPAQYFTPNLAEDEEKGAMYESPTEGSADSVIPSGPLTPVCPLMCECHDMTPEHREAFQHLPFAPCPAPPSSLSA